MKNRPRRRNGISMSAIRKLDRMEARGHLRRALSSWVRPAVQQTAADHRSVTIQEGATYET